MTWTDRAVEILEAHGPMSPVKFSQITNLKLKRAAGVLGRAAMYGHIVRLNKYRRHNIPEYRVPAMYAAKPANDR
jgi:hypothetical protein